MSLNYKHRKHIAGLTLIEILVTLIVLSIGMLGAAGLQVTSIKQTTNSGLRTKALVLTQDLAARIRANRNAVLSGPAGSPTAKVEIGSYRKAKGSVFPSTAQTSCLSGGSCTDSQIAEADLYVWSTQLRNTLPVTDEILRDNVLICQDDDVSDGDPCEGNGSLIVIQVAWAEGSSIDDSTVQTLVMEFEP